ncbi:MAG: M20/M25/M40 family metallo-hydrolase [Bacteroidales bacterium]
MRHFFSAFAVVLFCLSAGAQEDARERGLRVINQDLIKGQLGFLSSDWTLGRGTGSEGEYMAGDYLASLFRIYGIKPGGDMPQLRSTGRMQRNPGPRVTPERSYFQEFNLVEYTPGEQQEFSIIQESKTGSSRQNFQYRTDFSVDVSDIGVDLTSSLVFVGYGLAMDSLQYNDFKGLDLKGKTIIRISGYPGVRDSASAAFKKFQPRDRAATQALNEAKSNSARQSGAVAVIEITPGIDPSASWASNVPFRFNTATYEGDKDPSQVYRQRMQEPGDSISAALPRIILSPRALKALLDGTGIDVKAFESAVSKTLKPASREIAGKKIQLVTSVKTRLVRTRNVIGIIEGEDTSKIIVAGGHYDHLGTRDGYIYNGADDNASGTVGVLSIARAFAASGIKPKYTMVFACWTAEEKGLIGSEHFVNKTYRPEEKILLNLNYDMISRNDDNDSLKNRCSMVYTKPFKVLEDLTRENVKSNKLNLEVSFRPADKPRGGSDHTPFAEKGIPVMYFMAGFPEEYHTPYDHIEKVDIDKIVRITRLGYLNLFDIATGKVVLKK